MYLAALSLRSHPSPHDFVRQFSGENRFIVDFLTDEVLGRQPSEIREFLAQSPRPAPAKAPIPSEVRQVGP